MNGQTQMDFAATQADDRARSGAADEASDGNRSGQGSDAHNWKRSLAQAIREPAELLSRLNLPPTLVGSAIGAAEAFPLLVPESYVARMQPGDSSDPLLRQVLPLDAELQEVEGFSFDAVHDNEFRRSPGLLQKYAGRALLIAARSCAVHCRYCFRRHYPYGDEPRRLDDWDPAFQELEADRSITEVILSGGDPLMLTDDRLRAIVERLEQIPHLRRLRIHSRLPIVLPDRVTNDLLTMLAGTRLTSVVVVHANHAAELVNDCALAVQRLASAGFLVLNQSVLLRGVNDTVDALSDLSEVLIDLQVTPYYLHQLDRVAGAAHFEVPLEQGQKLIRRLRERLPGYAVPRFVQERPGERHKSIVE
ncbi:MAG: EF-P beta-lysylation protein EpmB [Planctomycetota bacterium]|jgi:EF-P beta-lysylation protein EpmB